MTLQKLKIQDYEVSMHLGCSTEEQKYLQPVRFNLEILFSQNLKGVETDELTDTIDYSQLTEIMKQVAKKKKYKLIEHLNQQVLNELLAYVRRLGITGDVSLSVQKIQVPIENLKNGVVFTCSTKV